MAKYLALFVMILSIWVTTVDAESNSGTGLPTESSEGSGVPSESTGGTGTPTLQLTITNQQVLLQMDEATQLVVGSGELTQGYSELPLNAFGSAQGPQAGWGRAQVLVGCGSADVLVERYQNGQVVETIAQRVVADVCVQ